MSFSIKFQKIINRRKFGEEKKIKEREKKKKKYKGHFKFEIGDIVNINNYKIKK